MNILITGGGTGGHLFPGIAAAEAFRGKFPDCRVLFVSTDRQVDAMALHGRDFETTVLASQGLKGKTLAETVRAMLRLPISLLAALKIVRAFRPDLVLGVGGYVTGPVVLAAWLLRVPICIHEQNSVPGLTNKILGRIVNRVFLSMPRSEAGFPEGKTVLTGNPVRQELYKYIDEQEKPAEVGALRLLVLGGSQGAHRLNVLVTGAMKELGEGAAARLSIVHQTGQADAEWVAARYAALGFRAEVAPFFDNMGSRYRQADVVVSRAGATTIAELTLFGRPALLVPFPFAADDHQRKNADLLLRSGAAIMLEEQQASSESMAEKLGLLLKDAALRQRMAERARRLGMPGATDAIVDQCMLLIGAGNV